MGRRRGLDRQHGMTGDRDHQAVDQSSNRISATCRSQAGPRRPAWPRRRVRRCRRRSRIKAKSSRPGAVARSAGGAAGRGRTSPPASTRTAQLAALGAEAHDIAVPEARRSARRRGLGRDVDRGRDLARGARHPPVGDQGDLEAAVLQHAQRRRQLVQFGHAVGARALEADDHDHVAVQLAGVEGGDQPGPGRRTPAPAPRGSSVGVIDGAGLEDRPAEIAAGPAACRRPVRTASRAGRSMVASPRSAGGVAPVERRRHPAPARAA